MKNTGKRFVVGESWKMRFLPILLEIGEMRKYSKMLETKADGLRLIYESDSIIIHNLLLGLTVLCRDRGVSVVIQPFISQFPWCCHK